MSSWHDIIALGNKLYELLRNVWITELTLLFCIILYFVFYYFVSSIESKIKYLASDCTWEKSHVHKFKGNGIILSLYYHIKHDANSLLIHRLRCWSNDQVAMGQDLGARILVHVTMYRNLIENTRPGVC